MRWPTQLVEQKSVGHVLHGMKRTSEYRIWQEMRYRCSNPNHPSYSHYGGRGVRVCARWNVSFTAFYSDMGPRPTTGHSIDRIDVDGNYEPSNCRWATQVAQTLNRRPTPGRSGYPGVKPMRGRWQARITVNYVGLSLGTFDSPEEAYSVYLAAHEQLLELNV